MLNVLLNKTFPSFVPSFLPLYVMIFIETRRKVRCKRPVSLNQTWPSATVLTWHAVGLGSTLIREACLFVILRIVHQQHTAINRTVLIKSEISPQLFLSHHLTSARYTKITAVNVFGFFSRFVSPYPSMFTCNCTWRFLSVWPTFKAQACIYSSSITPVQFTCRRFTCVYLHVPVNSSTCSSDIDNMVQ